MKRKTDNTPRNDKNKSISKKGLNVMLVLLFIIQLLLPLGLHASAVGEAEETKEIANAQVEKAEETAKQEEEASEMEVIDEKEKNEEMKQVEEETKKVEESKKSTKIEEDGEEDVDEGELAEDYPAVVTPEIPTPEPASAKAARELKDTIAVDKRAKRTTGCRTFEVNLNITGELQQAPVDVVLVIDKSRSMRQTAEDGYPKIYRAKEAAKNFSQKVLGSTGIPGSRVSVVSFSGSPYTSVLGSQNDAITNSDLTDDLKWINYTINRIETVASTNTEAGFKQGEKVIEGELSKQKPNSNKVVVMLTDGLPTTSK